MINTWLKKNPSIVCLCSYTESLIDYKCTLVNVVYTAIHDMCSYRTNIIQASLNVQTMIISNKLKEKLNWKSWDNIVKIMYTHFSAREIILTFISWGIFIYNFFLRPVTI